MTDTRPARSLNRKILEAIEKSHPGFEEPATILAGITAAMSTMISRVANGDACRRERLLQATSYGLRDAAECGVFDSLIVETDVPGTYRIRGES